MKHNIIDGRNAFLAFIVGFAILYITVIINIETIFCAVKHQTLKPPYGYTIVTNGIEYRYVSSSGFTNTYGYKSKSKAVTRAWFDWEYDQKMIQKANAKWKTVEF